MSVFTANFTSLQLVTEIRIRAKVPSQKAQFITLSAIPLWFCSSCCSGFPGSPELIIHSETLLKNYT